jgi:hypothetical protein
MPISICGGVLRFYGRPIDFKFKPNLHLILIMSTKILSLHGKGLKLDTRADIEPWIRDVDPTTVEEVHFGGNTIGVDAAKALAEFLEKTTVLKVNDMYF